MNRRDFRYRLCRKLRLLERLNWTLHARLNDVPVRIPVFGGMGDPYLLDHEAHMLDLLGKLLRWRDGVFVDIGANLGQTLLKVKSLSPATVYYGFEPNPACVYYLDRLIQANAFERAYIIPIAIAAGEGIQQLHIYNNDVDQAASIIPEFRPDLKARRTLFTPTFRLDRVLQDLNVGEISVIKIDVEGAEVEVLSGIAEVVKRWQPVMMCEVLPAYRPDNKIRLDRQQTIEILLQRLQYRIFRVCPDAVLQPMDAFGIHGDMALTNYLFIPEGRTQELRGRLL